MNKSTLPALIVFLVLWLCGGAYWLSSQQSKSDLEQQLLSENQFVIKDGSFKAEAPTLFEFQTSEAEIIINETQMAVLESLATYMDDFSEKQLKITASFGKNETNNTDFENLGVARAETIKNILVRQGAPESSISTEAKKVETLVLNEKKQISGGVEFDIFDKDVSNAITEAPFLKEKFFHFEKNKHTLTNIDELGNYGALLKQYLVDKKDVKVLIVGFCDVEENKKTSLLRAQFIKDAFLGHGIPLEKISVEVNTPTEQNSTNQKVKIKVF